MDLPTHMTCPLCEDSFALGELMPETIVAWMLTQPLQEVLKLQTALAKQGVCLTVSTPEVFIQQPE